MMSSFVWGIARTGVQLLGGYVFTWLASHGVNVPVDKQTAIVQWVMVAGIGGLYAAGVRWLETRKGYDRWSRLARAAAKVLMAGLSGKQPVYVEPGQRLQVINGNGDPRTPR